MLIIDKNEAERIYKLRKLQSHSLDVENSEISDIKGIGGDTISRLVAKGIKTKQQLLNTSILEIKSIVNNPISCRFIERFFEQNNK